MKQCFCLHRGITTGWKQSETNDLQGPKPAALVIRTKQTAGFRLQPGVANSSWRPQKTERPFLIGPTETGQVAPGFKVLQQLFSFLLWPGVVSCFFPSKPHLAFYDQVPQRDFIRNSRDAPQKRTRHRFHLCRLIITLSVPSKAKFTTM